MGTRKLHIHATSLRHLVYKKRENLVTYVKEREFMTDHGHSEKPVRQGTQPNP